MLRTVVVRAGQALVTLWATSVLAWCLLLMTPGDPAKTVLAARGILEPSPAQVTAMQHQLGLDGPVLPRYWHWFVRLLHGDFGTSWQTGHPVMDEFATRLPATVRLTVTAMIISIALSLLIGLLAASGNPLLDKAMRLVSLLMIVTPSFVVGLFVLNVLVVHLNLGVVVADGSWATVGWPAVTLATGSAGYWSRVLRASLLEARSAGHLQVSRARGASPRRQLLVHVLPNAVAPYLTVIGLGTAALLGGAPIAETVYTWPGIGAYTVQAIGARDLPVVVAYAMLAVAVYVVASLAVDLVLMSIDPRLRSARVVRPVRRAAGVTA